MMVLRLRIWYFPNSWYCTSTYKGRDVPAVKLSNLKYMNVMVNDQRCVPLVDLGAAAEIGIVSQSVAKKLDVEMCGHI